MPDDAGRIKPTTDPELTHEEVVGRMQQAARDLDEVLATIDDQRRSIRNIKREVERITDAIELQPPPSPLENAGAESLGSG